MLAHYGRLHYSFIIQPPSATMAEMPQNRDYWDIVALVIFVALLGACVEILGRIGDIALLRSFGFFDLTVVSLAAFRLTHLLTFDKIFAFVRNYFDRRGKRESDAGLYRYIDGFLDCIWCTGMWSGLIALTAYLLGMWGQFVVYAFAAAGVGSLLQLASLAFAGKAAKN